MFSALKKLTTKSSPEPPVGVAPGGAVSPAGGGNVISAGSAMDASLQRKFAQRGGVHYNMKLVIKGDRNTGKTCLWNRLQGHPFRGGDEPYTPTDEIQVAHIHWNYKAADDIVKVEVWDVVDKGRPKKKKAVGAGGGLADLKIQNSSSSSGAAAETALTDLALDAELVDVYKGSHAVVFMMDVTKLWTFDYIKRELPKVPKAIPILVMANFIDLAHHRQVTRDQVTGFIEEVIEGEGEAAAAAATDILYQRDIRYVESSMRNGFGLKLLHKFLNLPYLFLQRRALQTQLEINATELHGTKLELELFLESEEADYDVFLEGVTKKRRHKAESLAPAPTVDVVVGQPSNTISSAKSHEIAKTEKEISAQKGLEALAAQQAKMAASKAAATAAAASSAASPAKVSASTTSSAAVASNSVTSQGHQKSPSKSFDDVDSFMPSTHSDNIDNFLDNDSCTPHHHDVIGNEDSDDSDVMVNPMVMKVEEDLDDDDHETAAGVRTLAHHRRTYSTGSSSSNDSNHHINNKSDKLSDKMSDKVSDKLSVKSSEVAVVKKVFDEPVSDPVTLDVTLSDLNVSEVTAAGAAGDSGEDEEEEQVKRKKSHKKHKKEKKKKRKSSDGESSSKKQAPKNDLEAFLNGTTSDQVPTENYEEL